MKTTMYVMTHKMVKFPLISSYRLMLVGASVHRVEGCFNDKDDTGVNISEKNPSYCELTGLFWIWKNSDVEIVGISHYRRFFSTSSVFGSEKHYITKDKIEEYLQEKRVILPKPRYYKKTLLTYSKISKSNVPNIDDVKEMHQAIKAICPEYLPDFEWFFGQNKTYLYNMCIMKKVDFDSYCKWLFSILFFIEKNHNIEAETAPYRKRLFGCLSERLLSIWIHHNICIEDIKELPVVNTDESDLTRIRRNVGNMVRMIEYTLNGKRNQ